MNQWGVSRKDNHMNNLFISIWKIDSEQDYFDIRLIHFTDNPKANRLFELSGKCKDLDANLLRIDEFVIHSGRSLALTTQYMLQQIGIKFKTNTDIDEEGDGMREWISPMDSGDQRLFFKSLFDSKVKIIPQS